MKIIFIGLFLLVFLIILYVIRVYFIAPPELANYQKQKYKIGDKTYDIFIADSIAKKGRGLSGVKYLPPASGMIFTFPVAGNYPFWMKDMAFSLDFVYIKNAKVVDLKENISPNTYPHMLFANTTFTSVIELNAGEIKEGNMKIGDYINEE